MTLPFSTPSGSTTINVPVSAGVADISKLPAFPAKSALTAGTAQMLSPNFGYSVTIRIRGIRVAAEHWQAFQELLPGYMWIAQWKAGELMTAAARSALLGETGFKPAYLTGDTYRSVHHVVTTGSNTVKVSTGPTTWYAPMIEYGLASHSGIGPRPFMLQAAAAVLPELIQVYADLAGVARHGAKAHLRPGPYHSSLSAWLRKFRIRLYSIEKVLGDIAPFAPFGLTIPGTSKLRAGLLGMARSIGDAQAVMGRLVGARFARRLTGKVTGRLIGLGSRTIFVNNIVTARITGAERLYNRWAGAQVTKYIDQNKTLAGYIGGIGK